MTDELGPWLNDPQVSGLWLDYDGTLAPIVDEPDRARPLPEVPELLLRLRERFAVVSIVSGRSAVQLVEWLGDGFDIWGLLGAQHATGDGIELGPEVVPYAGTAATIRDEAEAAVANIGMEGLLVEDKGVVITLHYRQAIGQDEARRSVEALAQELSRRHGFVIAPGKASVELRPPVELSKASVVRREARRPGIENALVIGDDLVDLEAFTALDDLQREGKNVLRVAVDSDEAPRELIEAADVVVDGPGGAVALLRRLAPA